MLLPASLSSRGGEDDRIPQIHADDQQVTEQTDLPHAGQPTALVANLPYNVATPILLSALQRFEQLATALVMVQSEVVDRLTAGPGSSTYGAPSVKSAWYGRLSQAVRT